MISVDKKDLEYVMKPIVTECLTKHIGGENYFNNLDELIKDNETLLVLFIMYAVQDSGINNVIMSGGIGLKYIQMQLQNKIPDYIKITSVSKLLKRLRLVSSSLKTFRMSETLNQFLVLNVSSNKTQLDIWRAKLINKSSRKSR